MASSGLAVIAAALAFIVLIDRLPRFLFQLARKRRG
jgi:hypothetical protein